MSAHDRLLHGVAAEWDLRVDGAVRERPRPAVPVRTAEGEAGLLEHAPDGSPYEHLALRAWDGHGAVRLLRADPRRHLLLTERTDPDDDLRSVDAWESGTQIGTLYAVLHRAPIPQPPRLVDLAPGWLASLEQPAVAAAVPRRFAEQVRSWTPGLVDPAEAEPVLLHGDLRPGTVRGVERGWVAVAPRPVTGDPAYEVAAVLQRWDGAGRATTFAATCSNASTPWSTPPGSTRTGPGPGSWCARSPSWRARSPRAGSPPTR